MISIYAIYRAGLGSPSPFMIQRWDYAAGVKPTGHEPMFAADLDQARGLVPPGLVRHNPRDVPGEAPGLLETWEPR